jgi:Molecular chaperone (small heat shock protein)
MEDVAMRNLDLAPLWRSTVGFDRLFNLIDDSLRLTGEDNYPPYNIERTGEDEYRISLALAGFMPEEITLTAEQNMLTVEGHKAEKGDHQYLYQGISARSFRRQFNLADYVEVKGASFVNGLLQVTLVRELPEGMKPRRIAITAGAGNDNQQVQHKEAA